MVYSLVKLLFLCLDFFPILCYAMNKKTTLRHMGGVLLALISVSNAAFADDSENRLNAYKGNKLIPNEVNIATINSASSEHSDVAVFTPSVLSWKSYSNMQDAVFSKFMDWTKEDFEEFFKGYTKDTYEKYVDAWNFLSQTGNDHLQGAVISDEDAIAVLQAQLEKLVEERSINNTPFPCEGLDFSGLNLAYALLNHFTGMTAEQLFSAANITGVSLPAIDFTGADLSGKDLGGIDFSLCTGLTGKQLAAASSILGTQLPAIDFTGVDFSGKNLIDVDFSLCTGLTGTQLSNATNISGIMLTSEQYESMKTDLPSGQTIYVNGIHTRIP